jgi:hypothetical protein
VQRAARLDLAHPLAVSFASARAGRVLTCCALSRITTCAPGSSTMLAPSSRLSRCAYAGGATLSFRPWMKRIGILAARRVAFSLGESLWFHTVCRWPCKPCGHARVPPDEVCEHGMLRVAKVPVCKRLALEDPA